VWTEATTAIPPGGVSGWTETIGFAEATMGTPEAETVMNIIMGDRLAGRETKQTNWLAGWGEG
jgi:hypothetical protein